MRLVSRPAPPWCAPCASILHCDHGACGRSCDCDCAIKGYKTKSRSLAGKVYPHEIGFQKGAPTIVNLTVKRRYLTEREVERLMDCARKHGRYGHCDATMILVAYRHGLRASEVCDLQWQQIELSEGRLHVHRVKNGIASAHPIRGDEMRALRKLRRDYPKEAYVFVSERGGPISPIGFHRLVQRIGEAANMPFPIHPHMLRHACGLSLPTTATTRGPSSTTSGTRTSSTRSGTPKWRPTASRTFGEADLSLGHLGAAASGRRQARDDSPPQSPRHLPPPASRSPLAGVQSTALIAHRSWPSRHRCARTSSREAPEARRPSSMPRAAASAPLQSLPDRDA
jgi:hypothetical protein